MFTGLLLFSCEHKPIDDRDKSTIGKVFTVGVNENGDSIYYIITEDTVIVNDSIRYVAKEYTCNTYDSLNSIVHKGENIRANNVAALAIAKSENNTIKVAELIKETEEGEKAGLQTSKELEKHLEECVICKRIH